MSIDDVWDRLIRDPAVVEDVALGAALLALEPVGLAGDTVVVAMAGPPGPRSLATAVRAKIEAALRRVGGPPRLVVLGSEEPWDRPPAGPDGGLVLQGPFNDRYTFERFVIGASNRFAHAAAFAVAEAPATAYNPLIIYAGEGLGKTHLLQAIGHYTATQLPNLRCRYVAGEQFADELVDATPNGRDGSTRHPYHDVDVLLLDDIQFLQPEEHVQEEFFHAFNALHSADKQIVIASDRPPKQIGHLEERLKTRFKWGLITDIEPPDLETRLAILRMRAARMDLLVPPDVLEFIADVAMDSIRELEGALTRVIAHRSLEHTEVNLEMAQWVLKDLIPDAQDISVGLIQSETAAYFRLSVEELCSAGRARQLIDARQIAMYLTRELTDLSLPKIGLAFGGRDHTSAMHATKKISALIKERPSVFKQVQELTGRIKAAARAANEPPDDTTFTDP